MRSIARAATRGAFTGLFFGLGAVALLVGVSDRPTSMVILGAGTAFGDRAASVPLGATRGQVGLQF